MLKQLAVRKLQNLANTLLRRKRKRELTIEELMGSMPLDEFLRHEKEKYERETGKKALWVEIPEYVLLFYKNKSVEE